MCFWVGVRNVSVHELSVCVVGVRVVGICEVCIRVVNVRKRMFER